MMVVLDLVANVLRLALSITLLWNAYKCYKVAYELEEGVDRDDSFYNNRIFQYQARALLFYIGSCVTLTS